VIKRVDLRHYKCFDTLKLPLQRLTLLSGLNASGKSSVLQALVLLHQTIREHEWSERLLLNGTALKLGAVIYRLGR
jgi:predicted ATPase